MSVSHITYDETVKRFYAHFTHEPNGRMVANALVKIGFKKHIVSWASPAVINGRQAIEFVLLADCVAPAAIQEIRTALKLLLPYTLNSITVKVAFKRCKKHSVVSVRIFDTEELGPPINLGICETLISCINNMPELASVTTSTALATMIQPITQLANVFGCYVGQIRMQRVYIHAYCDVCARYN